MGARLVLCLSALAVFQTVRAQDGNSSYPNPYSGMPTGDYSPAWQSYFEVTDPLPNVTWTLSRSFAGNIPVNRPGHPNNTLFFWGFESQNGSLTAAAGERSTEPWGIWLNGGPGSSSMVGLTLENGPIRIGPNYGATQNNYSWSTLADYIWIDQPVGTGFSTADGTGYVTDEDLMGTDFMGFLSNLVKVFPSLATRPLYLTGESYAGAYIPYITKTYFGMENPPVNLRKIAIGDGTMGSQIEFMLLPVVTVLETYPQIIGYNTSVFEHFQAISHYCGYDLNLSYPQPSHFPTLQLNPAPQYPFTAADMLNKKSFAAHVASRYASQSSGMKLSKRDREEKREEWMMKRVYNSGQLIDPYYGCDVYDEMVDFALNFTFPWTLGGIDVYDIPDTLNPEVPQDPSVFLNDNRTRAALHAPLKTWIESIPYPFITGQPGNDPSVEPMAFFTDMATNATAKNVSVVIYSGNDDSLVTHRGSQVVIQNTTFGGIQGFTRKPSTPWYDDSGNFAGIVHQERNWTYVLFQGTGHLIPYLKPAAALTFLREFVLGSNTTGLVTTSSNGSVIVVGGENSTLAEDVMPGQKEVYYGSLTTQSTTVWPSATIAAWESFIATATATGSTRAVSSAGGREVGWSVVSALVMLPVLVFVSMW